MSITKDLALKQISQLKRDMLNCNIFSVYDYNCLSMQELLCTFFEKINQCVDAVNKTVNIVEWLVGEGLSEQVAIQLGKWLEDGTLANIINETVFRDLNTKITLNTNEISRIKKSIEAHVNMFGAIGDGVADDIIPIQKAIDFVKSQGGGTVKFSNDTYLISKPIFLPSEVSLVGEGMREGTIIKRRFTGISQLHLDYDYRHISRDELMNYNATICVEADGVYWEIKNMKLIHETMGAWGVFAPYCALFTIENVQTEKFTEHYRIFNAWNTNWNSIRMINGTYGIRLQPANPSDIDTACTSWVMNRVFGEYLDYAYYFLGLQYSSLNGMCADQINKRAYHFRYAVGIALNGMGCENSTGQVLKSEYSQLSVNGFYFLGTSINPSFTPDKQALIEVNSEGRLGCGLELNSGSFKSDKTDYYKIYGSDHSTVTVRNVRVWDGKQIQHLEPTSKCRYLLEDFDMLTQNKPMFVDGVKIDKVTSLYATDNYDYYPNTVVYNNVQDGSQVSSLNIPISKISKMFGWVSEGDNAIWLPLKISVTNDFNGSVNHIWNAYNSVTSTNKIAVGSDIVSNITANRENLTINFSSQQNRLKVVITLA